MIKASKTKRVLAVLIDYLICVPFIALILFAALPGFFSILRGEYFTIFDFWSLLDFIRWMVVALIIVCAYFTLVPVIIPGQTLGKKVMKIKVVMKSGEKVTFTTMFVREIIGRFLFDFTSLGLTTIMSLFLMASKRHEALHDSLAETKVVEK